MGVIETFFQAVDYIDAKTFDVIPALSIRGKIVEATEEAGVPASTQNKVLLSKGRYIFTYKPAMAGAIFTWVPRTFEIQEKKIRVISIESKDGLSLQVTLDVLENPIPLIAVSIVLVSVALTLLALSSDAVLTKVEKVFITPTATIISLVGLGMIGIYAYKVIRHK